MTGIRKSFILMFESFSELIFCSGWMLGALVVSLTFCNPNIAAAGFISFFLLVVFITILGIDLDKVALSHYFFNPVLVGMSIGAIFELSSTLVVIICISTIMTFLLTLVLARIFNTYGIPVLSLPFAIVSTGFYLAASGYNKLFSLTLYDNKIFSGLEAYVPDTVSYFLKAAGTIIFMPNVVAGAIIFAIILYTSRILAIHAVAAFIAGVLIHSQLSVSWYDALSDPYAFNYILVGLALGGTFILPSLRSSLIALVAVGVSVILVDVTSGFAEAFNIPVFTLPFNFTVILFTAALKIIKYPEYNYKIRMSPELSLSSTQAFKKRFKPDEVTVALPIKGKCSIYQACNGEWTHRNKWKYAYDLTIRDENDSMHSGSGAELENYYIFDKEVMSPVSGYVVNCGDFLPDNPIGKVDHINNWGNFIIIKDLNGNFIEISHLKQHSLKIALNDYVETGQPLALCGNSGYSPVPHVHIQAQKSYILGDETVPLNFSMYMIENELKIQSSPQKDDSISSVEYDNQKLDLNFLRIGAVYQYDVYLNEIKKSQTTFTVNRDNDLSGLLFLEDEGGSKLYFSIIGGMFYIYDFVGKSSSYLKILYSAAPRVPLIKAQEYYFKEYLPLHITCPRLIFACKSLVYWLFPWFRNNCGKWSRKGNTSLEGTAFCGKKQINTKVVFTKNNNGFKKIQSDKIKLILVER